MAQTKAKVTESEKEEVFIPRGYANEDQNLFVSVNGVNYLLPRGKTSVVPHEVAQEIRRSREAAEQLAETEDRLRNQGAQ